MIPGGGGGIGAIFGLDGRLRIVGCGMLTTAGPFEFEPLAIIVSLIDSIELEVSCSVLVVSGDIGKKFDADLNGGSIGEIIGGRGIDESGFIKVEEASTNGAFVAVSIF